MISMRVSWEPETEPSCTPAALQCGRLQRAALQSMRPGLAPHLGQCAGCLRAASGTLPWCPAVQWSDNGTRCTPLPPTPQSPRTEGTYKIALLLETRSHATKTA